MRGTLGTAKEDVPSVDAEWRRRWPSLVELGIVAFCVPGSRGGFGQQVEAATATAVELGAALHGSPYAAITASAHALGASDDSDAADVLAGALTGEVVCGFGVLRAGTDTAHMVDSAPDLDALVVADPAGDLLLLAASTAWTLEVPSADFDVSRTCGDVTIIDRAAARRLPAAPAAGDLHRLLLAADAIGGMQRALDRTVGYAAQRTAFGKPLAGFQAVQHRLVDHAVRARGLALVVAEAARLLAAGASDASRMIALAEVGVSSNAGRIVSDLVQLTGGIGFTWEYGLHHHLRRAHQDARLAANPRAAERRVSLIEGWATWS